MQILCMGGEMDNLNIDLDSRQETRRTANVISLMLPARMYEFECSWTTEQPLPAMEEFSCRLLLMLGAIYPNDLQKYFGLNNQEREVLLASLFEKRLAVIDTDGSIKPSSLLQAKSVNGADLAPSLTVFEERQEKAVFDLLSLQLLLKTNYSGTPWGLPEIEADSELMKASQDQICEAFSRQYRAHLENTRSLHEAQKTRLYKIGQCQQQRTLQVPIDMIIELEPIRDHDVRIIRDVSQKVGEVRKFPLSNELEAKIADYLGFFDEVLGSDGVWNLRGSAKADILGERFGIKGFDYAGNAEADLPVWEKCREAIVVGKRRRLVRKVEKLGTTVRALEG